MTVPDYQSLMEPLLRYVNDGAEHTLLEAIDHLALELNLTPTERQELIPSGGEPRFNNRVGWARTYLIKAGLLETTRRKYFRITERGRQLLDQQNGPIDNRVLRQFPEFIAFQQHKRTLTAATESAVSLFDVLDEEDSAADIPQIASPVDEKQATDDNANGVLLTGDERQYMTQANAAFDILHRAGGEALHVRRILAIAQEEHLFYPRGKTPEQSLASIMLRDPRFVNIGKNRWRLTDYDTIPIASADEDDRPESQTIDPAPTTEENDGSESQTTDPVPATKVWLFQANPRLYNLAQSLQPTPQGLTSFTAGQTRIGTEDEDDWTVTRYREQMGAGDIVLLYQGGDQAGIYALGELLAAPEPRVYDGEPPPWVRNAAREPRGEWRVRFRYTHILDEPILRSTLKAHPILRTLLVLRAPQGTNFSVTPTEWSALQELLAETQPQPLVHPPRPMYPLTAVQDATAIDLETLTSWVWAIERKGQAVLYGPPGTGKTYVARQLAQHLAGGGNGIVELVQFHPAYAYEDFIQGLRPAARDEGGYDLSLVPGRFLTFCVQARERTGRSVLIIDEINRANLARVFGELMYLLEYRNEQLPLAAGGVLAIPDNVLILATMNTADRSIALVDHALRRRFAFLHLGPAYEPLRAFHDESILITELIDLLSELNRDIGDPHYEVGTSFFFVPDLAHHLPAIWRMEIEPYLEEYFFDQPSKVTRWSWTNVQGRLHTP